MIEIDGSAGGGQVVRTAATLSALSGEAVRITDVRGGRPNSGMGHQHVAAVTAAAALCDARLEGDEHGAETLVFEPGELRPTDVSVDVGTAGSVVLVLDTVVPLATALDGPVTVTVQGGTDVEWAPPLDYLRYVKLPHLYEAGLEATVSVERRGFYPVGGGRVTLSLSPSELAAVDRLERGALRRLEVHSRAEASLEDAEVAERQASAAADGVEVDVPVATDAGYVEADSPGSVVVLVAIYEGSRAGFSALGERGKPSETVAEEAVADFQRFHDGPGAVDRHLADQLLVFLALAGGRVLAPERTDHVRTTLAVLEAFGNELALEDRDDGVLVAG